MRKFLAEHIRQKYKEHKFQEMVPTVILVESTRANWIKPKFRGLGIRESVLHVYIHVKTIISIMRLTWRDVFLTYNQQSLREKS